MFGLGKLLTLPYSLPAAGIKYCLKQVIDMAEQEMTDDTAVKEELMLLNLRLKHEAVLRCVYSEAKTN